MMYTKELMLSIVNKVKFLMELKGISSNSFLYCGIDEDGDIRAYYMSGCNEPDEYEYVSIDDMNGVTEDVIKKYTEENEKQAEERRQYNLAEEKRRKDEAEQRERQTLRELQRKYGTQ